MAVLEQCQAVRRNTGCAEAEHVQPVLVCAHAVGLMSGQRSPGAEN